MEKTSKIKQCDFTKEWSPPAGVTLYIHTILFENGDTGTLYHPKKMPPEIAVGTSLTYTQNEKGKITVIKQTAESAEMTKKAYVTKQVDVIGLAFSYAKDILVAQINAGFCVSKTKDVHKELFLIAEPIHEKMIALRDAAVNTEKEKTE